MVVCFCTQQRSTINRILSDNLGNPRLIRIKQHKELHILEDIPWILLPSTSADSPYDRIPSVFQNQSKRIAFAANSWAYSHSGPEVRV